MNIARVRFYLIGKGKVAHIAPPRLRGGGRHTLCGRPLTIGDGAGPLRPAPRGHRRCFECVHAAEQIGLAVHDEGEVA